MENNYEKLEKILKQKATRWMIIKDAKEWLEGSKKELREWEKTMQWPNILKAGALEVVKEILGEHAKP